MVRLAKKLTCVPHPQIDDQIEKVFNLNSTFLTLSSKKEQNLGMGSRMVLGIIRFSEIGSPARILVYLWLHKSVATPSS